MCDVKKANKILVGKSQEKRLRGRRRRCWEDNIELTPWSRALLEELIILS
jgi:hypothetical protein